MRTGAAVPKLSNIRRFYRNITGGYHGQSYVQSKGRIELIEEVYGPINSDLPLINLICKRPCQSVLGSH